MPLRCHPGDRRGACRTVEGPIHAPSRVRKLFFRPFSWKINRLFQHGSRRMARLQDRATEETGQIFFHFLKHKDR